MPKKPVGSAFQWGSFGLKKRKPSKGRQSSQPKSAPVATPTESFYGPVAPPEFHEAVAARDAFLAGLAEAQPQPSVDSGAGYVDPGGYAPDPALVAALSQLDLFGAQAGSQIDQAESQWRERLAHLRQLQEAENAAVLQTITQDAAAQRGAYDRAVDPILADIAAQGFQAHAIQQQAALDQQRLADYGQRQADLSRRFAEIQNRSFSDRDAAATGQMAGARAILANNLQQMRAELLEQLAGSGGGGGGGGFGGGGGRGGSDTPPLGILKALAEANTPLPNPLNSINYTGPHRGFVRSALRQIEPDLSNVGKIARITVRQARKKGLNQGGFVQRLRKQVFKPLRKAAPKHQKAIHDKGVQAAYAQMWGQF